MRELLEAEYIMWNFLVSFVLWDTSRLTSLYQFSLLLEKNGVYPSIELSVLNWTLQEAKGTTNAKEGMWSHICSSMVHNP